jgi:hypothetical protein
MAAPAGGLPSREEDEDAAGPPNPKLPNVLPLLLLLVSSGAPEENGERELSAEGICERIFKGKDV